MLPPQLKMFLKGGYVVVNSMICIRTAGLDQKEAQSREGVRAAKADSTSNYSVNRGLRSFPLPVFTKLTSRLPPVLCLDWFAFLFYYHQQIVKVCVMCDICRRN